MCIVMDYTGVDGEACLASYLVELEVLTRSPRTVKIRRSQIGTWLRWLKSGDIPVEAATRMDVVAFLARFPSAATRQAYRAALMSFYRWLADSEMVPRNPTRRLPPVHVPKRKPRPIPDYLISEALGRATPAERSMIILGRFAGLRASEIAAAHRDYLSGDPGRELVTVVGKFDKQRELPAHPLVIQVLARAEGFVFPSPIRRGQPIVPGRVSDHMSDLLPGDFGAHSLRHAFGSAAYRQTRDLRLVQEWMGHADPATTAGYVEVEHDWAAMTAMHLVA